MLTSAKLQPCLLKKPVGTQTKSKELEITYKIQSISVFLDVIKVADFR